MDRIWICGAAVCGVSVRRGVCGATMRTSVGCLDLLRADLDRGRFAGVPLLKEKLDRGDDRLAVEASAHLAAEERIGERDNGHALMVGHVVPHDREGLADRHAARA